MFKRKSNAAVAASAPATYGIMAEFSDAESIIAAAHQVRDAGYTVVEAYTHIPVHGLDEALGHRPTRLPWGVFIFGLLGSSGLFGFMTWVNVVNYPMNIGGRPFFSWPAFIPITFEGMVLGAAYSAVFGLIAICGLPLWYHPVFNAPGFERATLNGFFLCIEAKDPQYDAGKATSLLKSIGATNVNEISE
jgi:hypothetical protein